MDQRAVKSALRSMRVPERIIGEFPSLPRDVQGVLVYGSRARGDALEDSDLDVLALVSTARPSLNASDVSVSFYTSDQLSTGIGTLFGAHLRRDSKIAWDPNGCLATIVQSMGDVDTTRLKQRARTMAVLFTTPEADLPKYLEGLSRQARYLLRSCMYAQAIEDGEPCFSVREIARRLRDPHLSDLLASRQPSPTSRKSFDECLWRLRALVGEFPLSPHGSLEATIVNEWGVPGDLLSAAFMALGTTGQGSMYAEVEKILL